MKAFQWSYHLVSLYRDLMIVEIPPAQVLDANSMTKPCATSLATFRYSHQGFRYLQSYAGLESMSYGTLARMDSST